MLPFFFLGAYQAYSKDNIEKSRIDTRLVRRSRTVLYRNARIFIGDGKVIESGSVLVKNGKIEDVFEGSGPDPKKVNAEEVEAAGKTILPGLIDMHVHLVAAGGVAEPPATPSAETMERDLAAYLYSGITAVKSVGDPEDIALMARTRVNSGQRLGAEFFICGPLFTAEGGHGTEYFRGMPEAVRARAESSFVRKPKSPQEGAKQVDELKKDGVDGIKAVLQVSLPGFAFNRLDIGILKAIAEESRKVNLPITVHTGEAKDVEDALNAGVDGIEHGSLRDRIGPELFERMKKAGTFYDPTISVLEGVMLFAQRKSTTFDRSLVQQTATKAMLEGTRKFLKTTPSAPPFEASLSMGKANLMEAYKAGVLLVTGTDAGNPMVFHGPTVQRELELWVEAGIPATVALQAATANAARALRMSNRIGMVKKGLDATLVLVDGNPLLDIRAMESISSVMFKGERIDRSGLFDQQ